MMRRAGKRLDGQAEGVPAVTTNGVESERLELDARPARSGRRHRSRFRPAAVRSTQPIAEGSASAATHLREGLYRRALAAADVVAATLALALLLPMTNGQLPLAALVGLPLIVFLNKLAGLYERDDLVLRKTTLDESPAVVQMAGLFTFAIWLLLEGISSIDLDASQVTLTWIGASALLLAARAIARWTTSRTAPTERCLVIGEPESITAVSQKLLGARLNVSVVAILELDRAGRLPGADLEATFAALVRRHGVDRVIIAPAAGGSAETLDLIRTAKHAGVRISVVPRMMEVVGSSVEFDHVDGLTMLGVRRFGLTRSSVLLKRWFDVFGATLLIAAAAPLLAAIAAAIKLETRGPVLFRQTRVGRDGERFQMHKFRSMVDGADDHKDALRHLNETEGLFKIERDPRVTRVGRVLRQTSLDELPQLFNVWRGEMSLVGPRPLVVDEDAQILGFHRYRLHLTPGMTGHWQILGATRVPLHEMVGIDYLYVANWSLWSDVKILFRTVPHVLASRGL